MDFAATFARWVEREPSIHAVAMIGSQVRAASDAVWQADAQSDWDFQIITEDTELFVTPQWAQSLGFTVQAYALRQAAIGGVPKIGAVFAEAEIDLVLMPYRRLEILRQAVAAGQHLTSAELARTLQDLAVVVRPGWRFLKGAELWEPLYQRVVADIADPRLEDPEIRNLAETFVCDWVWVRRKLARGEYVAGQRMLHRALVETNLRLLHELKLRRSERSFPEGRRIERIASAVEVAAMTVSASPERASLEAATEQMATTLRALVRELVGDTWRWPAV